MSTSAKLLLPIVLFSSVSLASAQEVSEPGGRPEATQLALTNPDEFAWQLFMFANRPARPGTPGVADPQKRFGQTDTPVVWETWALSSGGDLSETYPKNGAKPVDWPQLRRDERALILDRNLEGAAVKDGSRRILPRGGARFVPTDPSGQEVRANKAFYEFIIKNEMFNIDGLEALLARAQTEKNRLLISFPVGAKEVKAQWLPIAENLKARYFWRETIDSNGNKRAWGLVAFHIITKDLPNWFWADFAHKDCEEQRGACAIEGQEPAQTVPVDSTTRGAKPPSGGNGVRNETKGTVWENYILRGTQIDFVTPFGAQTILSNPVIENGFQRSSCISCHARASVGPRLRTPDGKPVDGINTLSPGDPELGTPNPALFGAAPGQDEILYLQTDFIWSAPFRAQRKR